MTKISEKMGEAKKSLNKKNKTRSNIYIVVTPFEIYITRNPLTFFLLFNKYYILKWVNGYVVYIFFYCKMTFKRISCLAIKNNTPRIK